MQILTQCEMQRSNNRKVEIFKFKQPMNFVLSFSKDMIDEDYASK